MAARLYSLPDFRRLWFVGFTGMIARWLEMLAVALFAYQITGSAFVVAALTMLRLLPLGLFGAFLGAAADRFERRRALVLVVAGSVATTFGLALLASFGAIEVWHLAVGSFVNGICWAADNPVRRMMIGDAVGPDRMGAAMSFDAGTNNVSRVLGPVLSGLLFESYGLAGVLWFNVALCAAGLAAALRVHMRSRTAATPPMPFINSIGAGFAWLRRDPRLIGVFAITIIFNVFGWPFTSMIPVIATDYLKLGPEGVGLLAACDGIGGLAGALLIAGLVRPGGYGRLYVIAVALYLLMTMGFALAPAIPLAAAALFLSGMFSAGFSAMQATLVYRFSPVEMRARLLGVLSVCIGMGPIGFLYLGFLAEVMTPRTATVALGAQGMLALLLTRRYWVRVLRA